MRTEKVTTPTRDESTVSSLTLTWIVQCTSQRPERGAAIERLLDAHRPWVVRRCMRWVRSRADAEDVAQEVLIRVCSALDGLERRHRFRPWLARIVDNQCKTHLKRNQRWVTVEHIEELIDLMEHATLGDASDTGQVDREAVRLAIDALPDAAREVLILRYFHDQSLEQMSQTLDVSLSAAKMRLYRALERFSEQYRAIEA